MVSAAAWMVGWFHVRRLAVTKPSRCTRVATSSDSLPIHRLHRLEAGSGVVRLQVQNAPRAEAVVGRRGEQDERESGARLRGRDDERTGGERGVPLGVRSRERRERVALERALGFGALGLGEDADVGATRGSEALAREAVAGEEVEEAVGRVRDHEGARKRVLVAALEG